MVAYVLKAVVGQALGDAFHAVGDVGRKGLPLLHDAHQLGGEGGEFAATSELERGFTCVATALLMKFG